MRKDYDKEFIEIDTAPVSIATILKQAQYNIGKTMYTDALLIYAYNCNPTDIYIVDFVARIVKQRRVNEVSLPGAPHEMLRSQQYNQDSRARYRSLDMTARTERLKSALLDMYKRKLFTTKNHWIGTFLVVRDRLEKAGFTQTDFVNMADSIIPDEFPERLHISESTMKNFTKVITDPHDRNEAYYDMKNNPQEDFCEELWNAIEKML
jgi:hypothetical protein